MPPLQYLAKVPEEGEDGRPEFSAFTLRGDRFAGGRLPIDALIELERYRAILLAAAERAWSRAHPGQPLPQDFAQEFDLAITEVRDGSATSLLERPDSAYGEYFDLGRDETERLFQEIVSGLALPALDADDRSDAAEAPDAIEASASTDEIDDPGTETGLEKVAPRSTFSRDDLVAYASLPALRDLGSSLQIDEAAEISTPDGQQVEISFSARTTMIRPFVERVEILTAPPAPPERKHRQKDSIAGRLIALNPEKRNYTVRTLLFGEVSGRYKDVELFDDLREVLNSNAHAPVIRIVGRMAWVGDKLDRILEAKQIELLEVPGEAWSRRIVELASLPPNWEEESQTGEVISFTALEAARELLRAAQESQDSAPGIFPMEDGGVHLEWTIPTRVTSVEISADEEPEFVVHSFTLEPKTSTELTTTNIAEATTALLGALE